MTRRPAVTLIEVLISMFIMAIGMLALLVLFPLGAVSMGQALKDDRCASTAAMAENVAIAMNIRHDSAVPAGTMVYVDPYGAIQLGNVGGVIPRVSPSFVGGSTQLADRWFSLPDDMTFSASGTPDVSSGLVDRGRAYSYAYLLRPLSSSMTQLFVVVYNRRPVGLLTQEPTFPNSTVTSTNSVQINSATTAKRGGWILDPATGNFYRVTNIQDSGGVTSLETQQPLQGVAVGGTMTVVIMENVAEVFDKGTSWQP